MGSLVDQSTAHSLMRKFGTATVEGTHNLEASCICTLWLVDGGNYRSQFVSLWIIDLHQIAAKLSISAKPGRNIPCRGEDKQRAV